MKITLISDTHGQHHGLESNKHIPEDFWHGDVIIHAGDVGEGRGHTLDFLDWYEKLDFRYKIFVAGNHDHYIELDPAFTELVKGYDVIYLQNDTVDVEGKLIYGSPYSRNLPRWAFQLKDEDAAAHWATIPDNTDIIVVHGPPFGVLDRVRHKKVSEPSYHVGCNALYKRILEVEPELVVTGHIHEGRGIQFVGKSTVVNASVLDEHYQHYPAVPFRIEL